MAWTVANIDRIMIVSGVLAMTMICAALAPVRSAETSGASHGSDNRRCEQGYFHRAGASHGGRFLGYQAGIAVVVDALWWWCSRPTYFTAAGDLIMPAGDADSTIRQPPPRATSYHQSRRSLDRMIVVLRYLSDPLPASRRERHDAGRGAHRRRRRARIGQRACQLRPGGAGGMGVSPAGDGVDRGEAGHTQYASMNCVSRR